MRTTAAAVLELMTNPVGVTEAQITVFLTPANVIVTNYLADYITEDDDLLELIERYLAAHFVAMSPLARESKSEGIGGGDISVSYMGNAAMGLDFTTYGQTAKILDTTGKLIWLDKKGSKVAIFETVSDVGSRYDF